MIALVDDEDFERVRHYKWRLSKKGYVESTITRENGKQTTLQMHRMILNAPKGKQVDHADRNKRNNQRHNLRLANNGQNGANKGLQKNNTSGFKGVTFDKQSRKYRAQAGNVIRLGSFVSPEDAARAYDRAAILLFGEFALTNESLGLIPPASMEHEYDIVSNYSAQASEVPLY